MSITNGWTKAEREAFNMLLNAVGGKEGKDAFLGAIPAEGVNMWALDTGGGEATIANGNCYSTEDVNASITGIFTEREAAQEFVGLVKASLSKSTNMNGVKNVQWFRPVDNATLRQDLEAQIVELSWAFELVFNNV